MMDVHCFIRFSSALSLRKVAELISAHLFGGLQFRETEEFDEMPGVRLDIMMLNIRIQGDGPVYGLLIDSDPRIGLGEAQAAYAQDMDIGRFIERALALLTEIKIIPT